MALKNSEKKINSTSLIITLLIGLIIVGAIVGFYLNMILETTEINIYNYTSENSNTNKNTNTNTNTVNEPLTQSDVIFFIKLTFVIIIPILIIFLWVFTEKYPKNKTVKENLQIIDNLSGLQFESYFAKLLKIIGFYDIKVTKSSGDYGADIIAYNDNIKYAFQCKRYSSKVGAKSIGEILRGMKMYGCYKGVIITNNYFTEQAKKEALVCNVDLWDRNSIIYILKKICKESEDYDCLTDYLLYNKENVICDEKIENDNIKDTYHRKSIELKQMTINDYREMARKIQLVYYELGYKVVVTDIDTKNKYSTIYRAIYEVNTDVLSVGEQFIKKLGCENVRIMKDGEKHIKIIIPLVIKVLE